MAQQLNYIEGKAMKKLTKRILTTSILLSSSILGINAHAQSSVWQVSNGDDSLWIGGTVHILPKSEMPLPKEFAMAYEQANTIVLETALPDPNDSAAQMNMLKSLSYTGEEDLIQNLSPEVKTKLQNKLAEFGANLMELNKFRPAMISIILLSMELQKHNLTGEGVDAYFAKQATLDNKTTQYLETLEFQLQMLKQLGTNNTDDFINRNLDELDNYDKQFKAMINAWRAGDLDELSKTLIERTIEEDPEAYKQLIKNRNATWLPKIEAMFNNGRSEFVLVGAAHLAGVDSLLTQLEQKGYKVTQIDVPSVVNVKIQGTD